MAFGFWIDFLFIVLGVLLMAKFRIAISSFFFRLKLRSYWLFLLSSVPFIILEENINCMPEWCMPEHFGFANIIPPTTPILLIFIAALGLVVIHFKPKHMRWPLIGFCIWGIVFEIVFGFIRGNVLSFNLIELIFGLSWVAISYAFLVIVPLTLLIDKK